MWAGHVTAALSVAWGFGSAAFAQADTTPLT
jgi:hypothetical protein